MRVPVRDERNTIATNDASRAEEAASGIGPALKRVMIRTSLNVRARLGAAAQAVADACHPSGHSGGHPSGKSSGNATWFAGDRPFEPLNFSDLPAFKAILKHREIGRVFAIADPFYRPHERRAGAETWIDGRRHINFASYDYLGLNQHPAVAEAAKSAIERFGTSVSASRIVAGERPLHRELETALAQLYRAEAAVAFVSGHATNVSTIATLASPDDLILYDELSHNSVLVGCKLSRATALAFRHNDMAALENLLNEHRHRHARALIIVEGLYSMDGDVAPLPALIKLKKNYGAWLMVDEAHAIGVLGKTGRGSAEHFGIDPNRVDIWMGTLSKTLASCGGYIAGKQELIDILKFQAPGLVYSVGLSPPLAASAAAALRVLKSEPQRVAGLQGNGKLFLSLARAAGLDTARSEGHAIVSVIVGDLINAGRLAERLLVRGLNVLPIIYPAVPLKAARLRFFLTSEHTPEQIHTAIGAVREELDGLGRRQKAA
jgi:8-amino-7-oxononanoate synthase